ncbi:MAG: UPF0262 family protein [Rhodospirillaceae bacterium]
MNEAVSFDPRKRIIHIKLDERTVVRRKPEVEHERAVAIFDLLEENFFEPVDFTEQGPFNLHLSAEEGRLIFDVRTQDGQELTRIPLPLTPFRSIVRDYFMVCESYYAAIKRSTTAQIEALDMGRRGLHNDGSTLLQERLAGKITIDHATSRRLFTLVCVLHVRG